MFNTSFFKFLFGFALILLLSFGVIFVVGYLDESKALRQEAAAAKAFLR